MYYPYSQLNLSPNAAWIDESITISNGTVILTPVSSQFIYCLELTTGKSKWIKGKKTKSLARGDSMYVATIDADHVYLVGAKYVRAIKLSEPKEAWKLSLDDHGRPSGRGYFTAGHYFMPTTDATLLKVNLTQGKIVETRKTQGVLGNLFCYQGDVISHGVDYISIFPQVKPVRKRIADFKSSGSEIASDDRLLDAQLMAHDQKYLDAIKLAEQIYQKDKSAAGERLLLDLITDFMSHDFASANGYADTYHEKLKARNIATYLTARIDGLVKSKRLEEALSVAFDLAGETQNLQVMPKGSGEVSTVSRKNMINRRFDIWFNLQVQKVLESTEGDATKSKEIADLIRTKAMAQLESIPNDQFVFYTRMIGNKYFKETDLMTFAERYLANGDALACEFALAELFESESRETRAKAEGMFAELMRQNCEPQVALGWYSRLKDSYGDVVCFDGKTGNELFEKFRTTVPEPPKPKAWKVGRVETSWTNVNRRYTSNSRMMPMDCLQADGRYKDKFQFFFNPSRRRMVIRDEQGKDVADIGFLKENPRSGYSTGMTANYMIHGNLLVAVYGYHIVGVDLHKLRKKQKSLIWRIDTKPTDEGANASPYMMAVGLNKATDGTWGNIEKSFLSNFTRKPIGKTSQILKDGFCYMKQTNVVCADPLTGTLLWQKGSFPAGSQLTSNGTSVCVIEPNGRTVHLLNLRNGSLRKKISIDSKLGSVWQRSGSGAILSHSKDGKQTLSRYDFETEKVVWTKEFPSRSRGVLFQGKLISTMTPEGEFEMTEALTGDTSIKCSVNLDTKEKIYGIEVVSFGKYWRLIARKIRTPNTYYNDSARKFYAQGIQYMIPLTNGYVQLINRETGKAQWKRPVYVEYFSIPDHQPSDSPVLVMGRQVYTTTQPSFRRFQVGGIDTRTGRELFLESTTRSSSQLFNIVTQNDKNLVQVNVDRNTLNIQMTENLLSPGPVAHMDVDRTYSTKFEKELKQHEIDRVKYEERMRKQREKQKAAREKAEREKAEKEKAKKDAEKKNGDTKKGDPKKEADKKDANPNKKDKTKAKKAPVQRARGNVRVNRNAVPPNIKEAFERAKLERAKLKREKAKDQKKK